MLPTIEEAENELNPGLWTKHSINVGIAARNIARKPPIMVLLLLRNGLLM